MVGMAKCNSATHMGPSLILSSDFCLLTPQTGVTPIWLAFYCGNSALACELVRRHGYLTTAAGPKVRKTPCTMRSKCTVLTQISTFGGVNQLNL
jgi:hypothetical protein